MFKGSLLCLCGIIGSDGSEPSLGLGSGLGLFGSARVRHFEKSPGSLQARARHFEKGPENLSLKVKKLGLVKARALSERPKLGLEPSRLDLCPGLYFYGSTYH